MSEREDRGAQSIQIMADAVENTKARHPNCRGPFKISFPEDDEQTSSPSTPNTEIDAETIDEKLVAASWRVANKAPDGLMYSQYLKIARAAADAIQAAKAEGNHFLRYFENLAREHPSASAALDTARREWAKKGEG